MKWRSRCLPTRALLLRAAFIAAGGALFAGPTAAQDLFLTNARIVDPEAREVREGNLLVRDGRIVGRPEAAPAGFDGETLDLEGRWVIPGLVDLHTHSFGNQAPGGVADVPGTPVIARRMLYAGVTAFLDLFGLEVALFAQREQQRTRGMPGADLFTSLSCLTATDGHCSEYGIPTRLMDTPEDARRQVGELAQKRPDVVKIVYAPGGSMPSVDRETLAAAVATATENGIKTVIHVQGWQAVRDAVEVGASAVTHVPTGGPIPPDLAELMAERGVASIPTLAVQTETGDLFGDPSLLETDLAVALTTPALLDAYRSEEARAQAADWLEMWEGSRAVVLASVKTMADAGVTILTGTDSGNWGTIHGFSEHRELVKLVEAGLSAWEALAAATTLAGDLLGRAYGVNAGDEANLVVLDADPIEEISNTQRIAWVIHHGVLVDRRALLEN